MLFHDLEQRTPFLDLFESSLRARFPGEIIFHETYVEFPEGGTTYEAYFESEAETLRRKYAGLKLDLVIVVAPADFFAIHFRDRMFPGVPIVFTGVLAGASQSPNWPGATGLTSAMGLEETIDLALRLQPDTTTIAVISPNDPPALVATHSEILRYRDKVREIDFVEPPSRELFEKVAALPAHTVVLFHFPVRRSGQPPLAGYDFLDAVAQRLPTYSAWQSLCLDHGCIGGAYADVRKQMLQVADIAARVLSGERPDNIPVAHDAGLQVRVDWRALNRWGLRESDLPADSVVLFREMSVWERTKRIWISGLFIILGLSLLAAYLQYSRRELKKSRDTQVQLSGALIHAQEKERSRLASELHDDFSQRLALLAFGLQNTAEAPPDSSDALKQTLDEFKQSVSELGDDLHSLSHRLHSSTLDTLGLVTGLKSLCREFGARQGIEVHFTSEDIPHNVRPDVALCLFRITQEGLQNLKKHSGAKKAHLSLHHTGDTLFLSLRDEGIGFDKTEKPGLGILSMQGRARLLGGEFEIRSTPGEGTRIEVWVPFQPVAELST